MVLLFSIIGMIALAQDKSQAYYDTHAQELLPDARAAFRSADYGRTIELCRWYFVIVGDTGADTLRDKALRCMALSAEMAELKAAGQIEASREKAQALLALNPDDKDAQAVFNLKPTKGEEAGHEWVDLGLSVKWATCNIGASSPGDSGDYFAWGETAPKEEYSWKNYKWCRRAIDTFTKYNDVASRGKVVDNKSILEEADDAATVIWGGRWRMPTSDEQLELIKKCTWTWTVRGGKTGYLVTSKKNGNSIFLPASGWMDGALVHAGEKGFYWSLTRENGSPRYAFGLQFASDKVQWYDDFRYLGLPIRPVMQ